MPDFDQKLTSLMQYDKNGRRKVIRLIEQAFELVRVALPKRHTRSVKGGFWIWRGCRGVNGDCSGGSISDLPVYTATRQEVTRSLENLIPAP